MNNIKCLTSLCLATIVGSLVAAEKLPAPTKSEQDPVRIRLQTTFKSEYAKLDQLAARILAGKLIERAAEEGANIAARYVMLIEAVKLAVKGGDIALAVRTARQVDQDFLAPDLKELLASTFADSFEGKNRLEAFRSLAGSELLRPTSLADRVSLGQKWLSAGKLTRTPEPRLAVLRRSHHWLLDVIASPDLKGLTLLETEKFCQEVTNEIEAHESKVGKFSLYEGKWTVTFENKFVHEYVIKADGSLAYDQGFTPEGVPFVDKTAQSAKLVRRDGTVIVSFAQGKMIERFTLDKDKLLVEHFDPPTLYPKNPSVKGSGVREK